MEAAITAFAEPGAGRRRSTRRWCSPRRCACRDGIVASGGNRYDGNMIALWEFKTGTRHDRLRHQRRRAGAQPEHSRATSTWVGGWGINVRSGKAQGSTTASRKLHDLIKATGEYSIEAWVAPGNVTQEDARIVSLLGRHDGAQLHAGPDALQLRLLQPLDAAPTPNGDPKLTTAAADEDLQATLQHVVVTYDPVDGRRIYVNGEFTGDAGPGCAAARSPTGTTPSRFVLGNEVSGNRQFQGVFRLVAIHNRVLTARADPDRTSQAGVGEKFYLLFSVSHLVDVPQAYIMFEVSQFDATATCSTSRPSSASTRRRSRASIPIAGMRIGVNGAEADVGQAYRTLDTTITDSQYGPLGQPLANVGTVIALEKGPDADEFFLTFDVLGTHSNVRLDPVPLAPAPPADVQRPADIGLRVFDELNATMAELTGVSRDRPGRRGDLRHDQAVAADGRDHRHASSRRTRSASRSWRSSTATRWWRDPRRARRVLPGLRLQRGAGDGLRARGPRHRARRAGRTHAAAPSVATEPDAAGVRADLDALITRLAGLRQRLPGRTAPKPSSRPAAPRCSAAPRRCCSDAQANRGQAHADPQADPPHARPRRADPARADAQAPGHAARLPRAGLRLRARHGRSRPTVFSLFANPRAGARRRCRPTSRR